MSIQRLLEWTFADQRADLVRIGMTRAEVEADGGRWRATSADGCAQIAAIGALGCRVDKVGAALSHALHPDAEITAAHVAALGEDAARMIATYAKARSTPDWAPDAHRWFPRLGYDADGMGVSELVPFRELIKQYGSDALGDGLVRLQRRDRRGKSRGKRQVGGIKWTPVKRANPRYVEAQRSRYLMWRLYLMELRGNLADASLSDHFLSKELPPCTPWRPTATAPF